MNEFVSRLCTSGSPTPRWIFADDNGVIGSCTFNDIDQGDVFYVIGPADITGGWLLVLTEHGVGWIVIVLSDVKVLT